MEGSDESDWEKTDSLRGRNASLGVSRNASNDTGCIPIAKERDQVLSCTDNFDNRIGSSGVCDNEEAGPGPPLLETGDVSLRQWLDKPERSVDFLECLHIFRQIVETVNQAHLLGIVVHNVRPSCFVMSSFNRISFIESASCSSSSSDSITDGLNGKIQGDQSSFSPFLYSTTQQRGRPRSVDSVPEVSPTGASKRASEVSCLRSSSVYVAHLSSIEGIGEKQIEDSSNVQEMDKRRKTFPLKQIMLMELNWYTSPEEVAGAPSSFSSDIYRLGVLLFELFRTFSSMEEKLGTMSNLQHRVLPPQLLLKWPKEASFCLWLLHPQPNTRPKMSEVLQSEFLNEPKDNLVEHEAAIELREEIEEQELLLEFLLHMKHKKQEIAVKLQDTICFLTSDIEEVLKQQSIIKKQGSPYPELSKDEHSSVEKVDQPSVGPTRKEDPTSFGSRKRVRPGLCVLREEESNEVAESQRSESRSENQEKTIQSKSSRLMKNFKKLELAYFSTRCRLIKPKGKLLNRSSIVGSVGRGSITRTDGSSVDNFAPKEGQSEGLRSGWINPFLEGLCKYLSFSKLKVRANLKQGDLLNSSNLVCSLSFDRDKEFFATAGVNRKIKIFECDTILNEERDIHYPVTEMASRSKLTSICWNSYIKSQIASSDFEGVVQVWDVTKGQVFVEMREHERRVWSVDFSVADPTKLASGSDDGAVKLWNINQAILFLHLVDVSFETKRRKCWYYKNKCKCVLCSVPSGFCSLTCNWLS
ncbi:protein SPA1-RELATED 3-like isoform X2 [Tasmannia lanceolata]|uniref:protein SPA1-RELATED 3-like isoform X2 n=1 Tax=Tasmannia lanceolata TaxID=3420 RepID=UPI004064A4FA